MTTSLRHLVSIQFFIINKQIFCTSFNCIKCLYVAVKKNNLDITEFFGLKSYSVTNIRKNGVEIFNTKDCKFLK